EVRSTFRPADRRRTGCREEKTVTDFARQPRTAWQSSCATVPEVRTMFELDAFHLARIQFAFTVSFHILFPALTIGLASYLVVLEGMWLRTKNEVWRSLYHFWLKIFAVNFGMGVVSGLVMAYQFGTNWSGFSQFAGSITGPLLTYEVLTAFFLEAGFLGV